MSKNLKAWFSFTASGKFDSSDEIYFDISKEKWKKELENKYPYILNELNSLKQNSNSDIVPYFNRTLASDAKKWNVFTFRLWGLKYNRNSKKCPHTSKLLENIPGLISAAFSILDANTHIKPHNGDSNIMMRCHLGLKIPAGLPQTGIEVNGEKRSWDEGELFAFCDAQPHFAWNQTNEERWVLIFDVLRPEFKSRKFTFNSAMTGVSFLQFVFQKFYFIKHLPPFTKTFLMYGLIPFTFPYLLIRNLAGKLLIG